MCLYPKLIRNPKYKQNKKNGGVIPSVNDFRVLYVPIGWGECIECRKKKAGQWVTRLLEEAREVNNGRFVTLTFSKEAFERLWKKYKVELISLKGYELENELVTLATREFLEKWRYKHGKSVKHWLITELGHNGTERIHLHGILWTDKLLEIERIWGNGYVYIGYSGLNEKTVNYITKYMTKMDFEHKNYKPKILCSKGIGAKYINRKDAERNKYKKGETIETYKDRTGVERALPFYYKNKLVSEEDREMLWIEKLDKLERYVLGVKVDISTKKGEEVYKKLLKEAQRKNERLGYGKGDKKWDEINYEEERREMLRDWEKK